MSSRYIASSILIGFGCINVAMAEGFSPQIRLAGEARDGQTLFGFGILAPYETKAGHVPFADFRVSKDNSDAQMASIGLGYRYSLDNNQYVGVNAYADAIESANSNTYHQASVGLEYGSANWQATANYYLPIGKGQEAMIASRNAGAIRGDRLGILTTAIGERLGKAADLEVGKTIYRNEGGEFDLYLGGYWQERKIDEDNYGASLRGAWTTREADWLPNGTSMSVGVEAAYDQEKDWQFALQLDIGIGGSSRAGRHLAATRGVKRGWAANVENFEHPEAFEQASNYGQVRTFDLTAGIDATTLNQGIDALGNKGVALLNGSATFDDTIVLSDGRTMLGGGGVLTIETASGEVGTYQHTGESARLNNSRDDVSVIKVGSDTHLSAVTMTGGAEGVSALRPGESNITLSNLDISATAGDGIKLDGVDGITVSNTKVHDLKICDVNSSCEYSVVNDPNRAPNSAFSAVGSKNIKLDGFAVENSTYGIFIVSEFDASNNNYARQTTNVELNNISIENVRREGLILGGVDGAKINNMTVDNSSRTQNGQNDMDLVVLQASKNIKMNNIKLDGGINGLMIVNAMNLPAPGENNIHITDMEISNSKRAGIFLNPVSGVKFDNVVINNPGDSGITLLGNSWMNTPVKNIEFNNFQVNDSRGSAVTFMGAVEGLNGEISSNNATDVCVNKWNMGSLSQSSGDRFSINGNAIKDISDCK